MESKLKNSIFLKQGDCLQVLNELPENSIDLIVCDLPYNMLAGEWDTPIDLEQLWKAYTRVLKSNATVCLFSVGLFTYKVIQSNISHFKYKLIWKKNVPTGMSSAKYRPMKYYEEICIFQYGKPTYNPIKKLRIGKGKACYKYDHYCGQNNHINLDKVKKRYDPDYVNPSDVLEFNVVPNRKGKVHPTQKPVDLLKYLIMTYSNEGDFVLDSCMGSGSTGVAAVQLNRNFCGIEILEKYFSIAKNEIAKL